MIPVTLRQTTNHPVNPVKLGQSQQMKQKPVATELAVVPQKPQSMRPGRSGVTPPVEHRFKPGKEWRGNAGGRPKILKEECAAWLCEKGPSGKTNARELIESMGTAAMQPRLPHSVRAARFLYEVSEPTEAEERGSGAVDREFSRMVAEIMFGNMKPAKAIEDQSMK